MQKIKEEVKAKLMAVQREGMNKLVEALEGNGYFDSPGSTRFHGSCKSGLLIHCYKLEKLFREMIEKFGLQEQIPDESIIIVAYGHDLCKVGAYLGESRPFKWNASQPKGHAILSISRLKKFIELTEQEEELIKYHMGMYGTNEFGKFKGEYPIEYLATAYNNNKLAKLFYFCDDMSSQFLEGEEYDENGNIKTGDKEVGEGQSDTNAV